MASGQSSQPENALSVLLSALPTEIASSIQAGYSSATARLKPTNTQESRQPTTPPSNTAAQPTQTDQPISEASRPGPTSIPTTRPTDRPTDLPSRPTTFSTITSSSSSLPSISNTSTSPSSTLSATSSTSASSTISAAPTPSTSPEQQARQGTIAGIATGTAAGAVLIILLIFFLLRRRKQGQSPFASKEPAASSKEPFSDSGKTFQPKPFPFAGGFKFARRTPSKLNASASKRGSGRAYPESAWLYDPVRTPPGQLSPPLPAEGEARGRRASNEHLAPEVVGAAYPGHGQYRGPYHMPPPMSPNLQAANESSEPLLAPGPVVLGDNDRSREGSPYGQAVSDGQYRHSRSRSTVDFRQSSGLGAIREEGHRGGTAR